MKPDVIISSSLHPQPEEHEVAVAYILAEHFNTVIEFLQPSIGYKQKTPDIIMSGLLWEIKTPRGSSKSTIETQVRTALRQCRNIVIDGRITKISDSKIKDELMKLIRQHRKINRLIFISKDSKVSLLYNKQ